MKKSSELIVAALVIGASVLIGAPGIVQAQSTSVPSPIGPAPQPQRFEITYSAAFENPTGNVTVYLPVPTDSAGQIVETLSFEPRLQNGKPVSWAIKREAEYGNRFLEVLVRDAAAGDSLTLKYTVIRREIVRPLAVRTDVIPAASSPSIAGDYPAARFLQADSLVPLNTTIRALAREALAGTEPPADMTKEHVPANPRWSLDNRLKRLYDKTISMMRYDKSGSGWGRGDVVWACDNKRGNCTDFHSVLIGMARSSGIPAKFEIGLPIPNDAQEGTISGYHCWAWLYHPARGWVPMDASEGWKENGRYKEYYLGRIGSDRVTLSVGRDLKLGQRGAPLNYFVAPYAEAGNHQNDAIAVPMKLTVAFRKLALPAP